MVSFVGTQQKCICQICTCVRHRCPHSSGTLGAVTKTQTECKFTEYQNAYAASAPQPRRQPLRPAVRERIGGSVMETTTTYGKTYIKHQPCAQRVRKEHDYKPPCAPMDTKSTYISEYNWKGGKRADSFTPRYAYVASQTPFSHDTVYRVNYKAANAKDWDWCRAKPYRHKECIEKSDANFNATTTMKNDFIPHEKTERVMPVRPNQQANNRTVAFDASTSYNLEFTPKSTQPVTGKKPVEYRPNTTPFMGSTTAQSDYQQHPYQERRSSFKPYVKYRPSESAMEKQTTVMEAYQEWPIQQQTKPDWAKQKVYATPTQEFEKNSSYQDSYQKPVNFVRTQSIRPRQNGGAMICDTETNNGEITTQYRKEFVAYGQVKRPEAYKKTQQYVPPTECMMGETDYRANYKGEPTERARPCTPGRKVASVKVPFNHDTTYNTIYKGKNIPDCPAKTISDAVKSSEEGIRTSTAGNYTALDVGDGHHFLSKTDKNMGAKEDIPCTCKPEKTAPECSC